MGRIEDQLKHFSVKVNDGSGCIFQPDTNLYTYILTVRHNIEKLTSDSPPLKVLLGADQITVLRNNLENTTPLHIKAVYTHLEHDIALLVVDYIGEFAHELTHARPAREETLKVFGYPNILRKATIKTTSMNCSCDIEQIPNIAFEIISKDPLYSFNQSAAQNVIGFSGSGIFFITGDNLILKGIFPALHTADGSFNKLNAFYIDPFNKLAVESGLLELMPMGLKSFKVYRESALNSISLAIKNSVSENIDHIINSSISPFQVAEKFQGNLNVPYETSYHNIINNPKLWKSWIDLLTFLDVVTDQPDYTLSIFLRNIRLYHSPSKIIIDEMIREFLVDQKSMDSIENNHIVAFSGKAPSANKYLDKARVKKIVASIYDAGNIGQGVQIDHPDLVKDFCCIDVEHFAEKIAGIDTSLNPAAIKAIIKSEITKILAYGDN